MRVHSPPRHSPVVVQSMAGIHRCAFGPHQTPFPFELGTLRGIWIVHSVLDVGVELDALTLISREYRGGHCLIVDDGLANGRSRAERVEGRRRRERAHRPVSSPSNKGSALGRRRARWTISVHVLREQGRGRAR
jgi:hypothetical protein